MTDLTFARYWQQLTTAADVRVVQQAADTTEHLLNTNTNRERLENARTEARAPYTSHWYR